MHQIEREDKKMKTMVQILKGITKKGEKISILFLSNEEMENYISQNDVKDIIVLKYKVEIASSAEREIYYDMEHHFDMDDAHQINDENEYHLNEKELEAAVKEFRHHHDWNFPDYYQLDACLHDIVREKKNKSQD